MADRRRSAGRTEINLPQPPVNRYVKFQPRRKPSPVRRGQSRARGFGATSSFPRPARSKEKPHRWAGQSHLLGEHAGICTPGRAPSAYPPCRPRSTRRKSPAGAGQDMGCARPGVIGSERASSAYRADTGRSRRGQREMPHIRLACRTTGVRRRGSPDASRARSLRLAASSPDV
jgi:hypothetical protein